MYIELEEIEKMRLKTKKNSVQHESQTVDHRVGKKYCSNKIDVNVTN